LGVFQPFIAKLNNRMLRLVGKGIYVAGVVCFWLA